MKQEILSKQTGPVLSPVVVLFPHMEAGEESSLDARRPVTAVRGVLLGYPFRMLC